MSGGQVSVRIAPIHVRSPVRQHAQPNSGLSADTRVVSGELVTIIFDVGVVYRFDCWVLL